MPEDQKQPHSSQTHRKHKIMDTDRKAYESKRKMNKTDSDRNHSHNQYQSRIQRNQNDHRMAYNAQSGHMQNIGYSGYQNQFFPQNQAHNPNYPNAYRGDYNNRGDFHGNTRYARNWRNNENSFYTTKVFKNSKFRKNDNQNHIYGPPPPNQNIGPPPPGETSNEQCSNSNSTWDEMMSEVNGDWYNDSLSVGDKTWDYTISKVLNSILRHNAYGFEVDDGN